jgi:hypothetical protein
MQQKKLLPLLDLAKTIKESNVKLTQEDILNLVYYYAEQEKKELQETYFNSAFEQCKDVCLLFSQSETCIDSEMIDSIREKSEIYVEQNYDCKII